MTNSRIHRVIGAGHLEHSKGTDKTANPYPLGSYNHHLWNKGWDSACITQCGKLHKQPLPWLQLIACGCLLAGLVLSTVVISTKHLWW